MAAGPIEPSEVISRKNSAKAAGDGTITTSNNNSVVTIVNEGHHGAVAWKGSEPTPDGPIIIAESKYADGTLASCAPLAVGAAIPVGESFTAPAASPTHGTASVLLLFADGTVETITSGQSKTALVKATPYQITIEDLEGEPSASETLIDLNIGDMVVDIKKLDKHSHFDLNSPVGTAGIRG